MSETARGALSSPHTQGPPGRRPTQREIAATLGISTGSACRWLADGFLTGDETLEWLLAHRDELQERRRATAEAKRTAWNERSRQEAEERRRQERERPTRREIADALGISSRSVTRKTTAGDLPAQMTWDQLEEFAREYAARAPEETPAPERKLSPHAARKAEAKAVRLAEIEEQIKAGELKVRKLTRKDLARLEQGRERRLPLSDIREVAA